MQLPTANLAVLHTRLNDAVVGFPADAVVSIVRAVSISALPGAPDIIEGTVNWHGTPVPLVDVRKRLRLPARALSADQVFVILRVLERLIAIRVDDVDEVAEIASEGVLAPSALSPALQGMSGIAPTDTGAIVIYDVDAFLTQAEAQALDSLTAASAVAS